MTVLTSDYEFVSDIPKPLEILPVAAPPPKRHLSDLELRNLRAMEENILRELRLFLRQIVWKLMADRKFKEFLKPVDLEEVCKTSGIPLCLSGCAVISAKPPYGRRNI